MSNHYTSFEVSKKLIEAGVVFLHDAHYDQTGNLILEPVGRIKNPREYTYFVYPAYTSGKLLRELQRESEKRSDAVAVESYVLLFNFHGFDLEDGDDNSLGYSGEPEDALAEALIVLKGVKA